MSTRKRTAAAKRAARARKLRNMIAARVDRARREAWEELFSACAKAHPCGTVGGFNRWFHEAWLRSAGGVR